MTIGRKIWLCMMLAAAMVASTSVGAQPPDDQVIIMTQNIDQGNEATLRTGTPDAFAKFFTETVDTKPKDRAAAIAKEIRANQPDLVALQEVSILRKGSGPTPNDPKIAATEVVHDQLQLLRDALNELNEHYETVAVIPNSDLQSSTSSPLNFVVRLTDRTVILKRASSNRLKLSNVQVEEYWGKPEVGPFRTFGWGSVDVEVGAFKFRFVVTHLTPPQPNLPDPIAVQRAQALELIQSAGKPDLPGGSVLPVVYAGDFNTVAGLDTYKILVHDSGGIDAWKKVNPMALCPEPRPTGDHDRGGCTCCQAPNLSDPTPQLDHRIDLVIVPPSINVGEARLIGTLPADRTPSGLWPSDHAGVVVGFVPQRGGDKKLTNVQTGKCLTIAGGVSADNNVEAVQFTCDSHPSRSWKINNVGGVVQIQNVQTGKCLTIAGGVSTDNNVEAVQFTCDSHPSRTWKINNVGDVVQIQNVQTGKCLTIAGGVSTDNNVGAVQFTCDSHPSRTWRLEAATIGTPPMKCCASVKE
ncbi:MULTISPECIES: RICIN domain-containing protein [unclassified Bradyrhizobium]|uniref:RICIN domain-containing protein n=1 Tax=unclassified Bradyrhizobium TaxID=2631580 RepID=UPI002478E092|nr:MULTISPECIES: RICIN domain-containing protein [unclassified Bradyrhizobium]WGR73306.1 RICIN domain-containing protein [Bradyrhizobium sp. ISRA426]WGR78143.1 RICIN domain-containing protein [Bradyrhizobium sp. ISRA430]WGR88544.1 RICIN domain-containing protein [Bradyrhizobium sp. ISRA432]